MENNELNPDLLKAMQEAETTKEDDLKKVKEGINSDARQTPPSFDELVDLIEKNFKDYLEQSKAFTSEEIEQGWQRYKTLNHLYQPPSVAERGERAVWVKATEHLPGSGKPVKWRINGNEREGKETIEQLIRVRPASFPEYEWLDEGAGEKEVTNG